MLPAPCRSNSLCGDRQACRSLPELGAGTSSDGRGCDREHMVAGRLSQVTRVAQRGDAGLTDGDAAGPLLRAHQSEVVGLRRPDPDPAGASRMCAEAWAGTVSTALGRDLDEARLPQILQPHRRAAVARRLYHGGASYSEQPPRDSCRQYGFCWYRAAADRRGTCVQILAAATITARIRAGSPGPAR